MRVLFLLMAGWSAWAIAGAQAETAPNLKGKIDHNIYTSANGLFRFPVPPMPDAGGTITDNENVVSFDDTFRTHLSIAAFPFSREQRWEYETRGTKDYLIYFFTKIVEPDFDQRFPGSKIESAVYAPELKKGSLIVYTLHPGGSAFEAKPDPGQRPTTPLVAKRGNLCFVYQDKVFIITLELVERATERATYKKTISEENDLLRQRLFEVLAQVEFTSPSAAER